MGAAVGKIILLSTSLIVEVGNILFDGEHTKSISEGRGMLFWFLNV